MSTDRGDAARRSRRHARSFRRSAIATVGILAAATAGFGLAGALRGPALDEASVGAATALEQTDQRLVLRADQALLPVGAGDVTITPAVPIEVTSDRASITIRFTGLLTAVTEYRVSVAVTGAATGRPGRLEYGFTTPDLDLDLLVRDPDGPDQVRRIGAARGAGEVLFAADRIQEFATLGYGVAAVVLDDDSENGRLVIAPEGETITQEVALPGSGRIRQLQASSTAHLLGFVFSSSDYDAPDARVSQLLLFDPLAPSGGAVPVLGLDGEPLSVLDWRFVPATPYLVVQAFDQSLLLVDTATADAAPVPLGQHSELRGFIPGTVRLVVADPTAGSTIDLADGATTILELADDGRDVGDYRGIPVVLDDDSYYEAVSPPAGAGAQLDYEVLLVTPRGVEVVADVDPGVIVLGLCLSPNAQFLALELQEPGSVFDGYPNLPSNTGVATAVVDLTAGTVRTFPGFAASWCG